MTTPEPPSVAEGLIRKDNPELEKFFNELLSTIQHLWVKKHPTMRNVEVMAMLARAAGYSIGSCFADERELIRSVAIKNLDQGTADYVAHLPPGGDKLNPQSTTTKQ